MKNRIPTKPGQVKLIPIEGQENTFTLTRDDAPTEAGTPLDKNTFLTDETAAQLWKNPPADPTVDDAFKQIHASMFKVGDVLTTARGLEEDWLLCNGDVMPTERYPELAFLLQSPNTDWNITTHPRSSADDWTSFKLKYLNGFWIIIQVTTTGVRLKYATDIKTPYESWATITPTMPSVGGSLLGFYIFDLFYAKGYFILTGSILTNLGSASWGGQKGTNTIVVWYTQTLTSPFQSGTRTLSYGAIDTATPTYNIDYTQCCNIIQDRYIVFPGCHLSSVQNDGGRSWHCISNCRLWYVDLDTGGPGNFDGYQITGNLVGDATNYIGFTTQIQSIIHVESTNTYMIMGIELSPGYKPFVLTSNTFLSTWTKTYMQQVESYLAVYIPELKFENGYFTSYGKSPLYPLNNTNTGHYWGYVTDPETKVWNTTAMNRIADYFTVGQNHYIVQVQNYNENSNLTMFSTPDITIPFAQWTPENVLSVSGADTTNVFWNCSVATDNQRIAFVARRGLTEYLCYRYNQDYFQLPTIDLSDKTSTYIKARSG